MYIVSAIVDNELKEFFMKYDLSTNQYQFEDDAPEELKAIEQNISNTIQSQDH